MMNKLVDGGKIVDRRGALARGDHDFQRFMVRAATPPGKTQ